MAALAEAAMRPSATEGATASLLAMRVTARKSATACVTTGMAKMTLGELLKASRNRLGMTLDEVADAAGCSKSHLHSLEGDKCEPGIVMCARLSVALGLPVQAMAAAALTGALKTVACSKTPNV